MLTASEKRFIKSWEEQRQGGRVKYYLLYITMGTIVCALVIAFLTQVLGFGLPQSLIKIIVGSFLIVTFSTIFSWWYNEKKFKAIIQREVKEGMRRDDELTS
ncbi:hypothetical protein [Longitalea arenae]|uniref:hypothetical protein n=1 Tax=Longitalea arenae TaxID=2812558 RepID=UPI00196704EA|nr:hypothetical protein [Longitalea arenae]